MNLAEKNNEKFRALKLAIEEGMVDVEAGRVVSWDLYEFLNRARERANRLK
jgi:anti-sigma28 factor (negative regulator of flagellin synthesis)